jgi:DNA-binding transcriptional LysR family regulator
MSPNSIRHLEIALALARHRHFGRAAEALGVSQPSLTRSLKQLEETLGVRLFDRDSQSVAPTLFGRILIDRGELVIDGLAELIREIDLAKGLEVGELTIAVGPFPAEVSAQKALGRLVAEHPKLTIAMKTTDWLQVVDDVLGNKVDLGLADVEEASRRGDLETELLRSSPLRFVCRTGHPLQGRAALDLEEVMQFPWAGPTGPGRVRGAIPSKEAPCGVFEQASGRFRPRIVVGATSAARDVVLGSDALAVSLPGLIGDALSEGRLALLPVELPWLRLNYGFIWRRGRTLAPAAKAFMDRVRAIEAEFSETSSMIDDARHTPRKAALTEPSPATE